jgi:hypothetical protein
MAFENVEFTASRNINAVIYDADTQEMLIEYKGSGKVYKYSGVTGDMASGFSQAPSSTDYLRSVIEPQTTYKIVK